jgi:hypothetical protein
MELESLLLEGYRPFLLNNITQLLYTPQSAYQIILGMNGCGKSSLMRELSPLPATPGDFIDGGVKKWTGRHDGNHYELTSEIGKRNAKHSFICNGEEMNPGGTGAVQKELVQQHFKLTTEIHQVLLGKTRVKFTNMAPAKRQEWFQLIAPVDITIARKQYQYFLSKGRSLTEVEKHQKQELVEASKRLGDGVAVKLLEDEIQKLREQAQAYMEAKVPVTTMQPMSLTELENASRAVLTFVPDVDYPTTDSVMLGIASIEQKIDGLERRYKEHVDACVRIEKQIGEIGDIGHLDISLLMEQLNQLAAELAACTVKEHVVPEQQVNSVIDMLSARMSEIIQVLGSMPVKRDDFTKEQRMSRGDILNRLTETIQTDEYKLTNLQNQLHQVESAQSIHCPACDHQFKPGIEHNAADHIKSLIESTNLSILTNKAQAAKQREYLEEFDMWYVPAKQLASLLSGDSMYYVKEMLYGLDDLWTAPRNAIPELMSWLNTLKEYQRYLSLRDSHATTQKTYSMAVDATAKAKRQQVEAYRQQYADEELALSKVQANLMGCRETLTRLIQIKRRYVEFEQNQTVLLQQYNKAIDGEIAYANRGFNVILDNYIGEIHSRLGLLENQRISLIQAASHVDRLNDSLKVLAQDIEACQVLTTILSPKDGFIAEQLSTSVNALCDAMNAVIRNVWTYDLEILPCGVDSGELNYKFPLRVYGNDELPLDDICEGSESQCEMVNLAFRLIVMAYLSLAGYPLYLDELGREFDETHGSRVMQYLKLLVDSQQVSQVFLISHNPALHSVFTLADVNIINTTNITLPAEYNTCMTIQ